MAETAKLNDLAAGLEDIICACTAAQREKIRKQANNKITLVLRKGLNIGIVVLPD